MNVLMVASSSNNIDPYYLSIARSIANYLASRECNLVFGGSSSSMMGACYQEFVSKERWVYAFTTPKYESDLVNLDGAKHYIRENTFDLKKSMYENSDIIVVLPGGIGTLSELYSFIEENRSNDKKVPIIVYNEGEFFKPFLDQVNLLEENGFNDQDIYNYFEVTSNKKELEEVVDRCLEKERKLSYGK